MENNPVIDVLGRRLRMAVIGGGPGSFIGPVHRMAARLDDRFELVAGALSSDPERSRRAGRELGLADDRCYDDGAALLAGESARDDAVEVVAVMTPNDSHHALALGVLGAGMDLIIDKPLANTLAEATEILEAVERTGLVCCLTHNYTGYPLVRQARAMVAAGDVGEVRLVQVEYVQGGKARPVTHDPAAPLPWRYDPERGGPSLVLGDIGTHAHNLVRFVTGAEIAEVAADVGSIVPGQTVHDFAGALLRLDNGGRGSFFVTQAAAGVENCLRLRVSGADGTLEWSQEQPTVLVHKPFDAPAQLLTPNGPGILPLAARASRIKKGHPEGFPEAFANLYADAAEAIAARRSGRAADPLALQFPTAVDGVRGLAFVEAALASSAAGGGWTACAG